MISSIDRRRIFIFVAIAYGGSIALGLAVYFTGGIGNPPFDLSRSAFALMAGLMFVPLVANIVTRLVTREGWSNTLLRPNFRRGWRFYLAAWFLPVLATILGGVIYFLLFPSRFDPSMTSMREMGALPEDMNAGMYLLVQVGSVLSVAAAVNLLLGFGEEFGWRAYLLQKLMPLGSRKAVLLVGVIHAVWHYPLVFMGYEYGFSYWGAPVVGPMIYVVFVLWLSVFLAWVTLRSGSVWPAALGHGVINASALLMRAFVGGDPHWLTGPQTMGIVGGLGYALLALLIFFSARGLAPIASPAPAVPKLGREAPQGAAI
ncbi:MAG TPA: CPBP family intramembrane glutamic endopeptidase [Anaerolineales bacterium]|nr:CPBP family intramembrane glutamic endopeptidase [Anaerolineales bacterium]